MKNFVFIATVLILSSNLFGQGRFFTKNGHIDFYSHAPLEDIRANNNQVAVMLEPETGKFTFAVLIKSFEFEKALMQEHFNENYLESDEYPKSKFSGQIESYNPGDLKKEGTLNVRVSGKLTIHGVTKDVTADGTLEVKTGEIKVKSQFIVKPEDYNIKIPKAVRDNIAKEIQVNVDVVLKPY